MAFNMTKEQNMSDYVVNPLTGRLLKRNSKTYKKLISASLLGDEPSGNVNDNTIMTADNPRQAKELKDKMNKGSVGKNKIITTRGSKVLKTTRRPTRQETINKVSDIAINSVMEHKNELLESDMTDQEMEAYIKAMISKKLVGQSDAPKTRAPTRPVRQRRPEPEPVYESDDTEIDGYDDDY